MQNQESPVVFNQERATSYNKRFEKIAPMRDALHLLMRLVLSELPSNARILCVGAGTGLELLYLARQFPGWSFTAVEPAASMLEICRLHADEEGISSRCTFHQGYLDSLSASDSFDAATSLLVSHFLTQSEERSNFFKQIGLRLRPGGYLINADLTSDMTSATYKSLLEIWLRMLEYSEVPADEIERFRASYGNDVALLPQSEVEAIIAAADFDTPVLFLQTLLIHAWYSKRSL